MYNYIYLQVCEVSQVTVKNFPPTPLHPKAQDEKEEEPRI